MVLGFSFEILKNPLKGGRSLIFQVTWYLLKSLMNLSEVIVIIIFFSKDSLLFTLENVISFMFFFSLLLLLLLCLCCLSYFYFRFVFLLLCFFFQRKPNIFYPPAPSIANRCNLVALNFPNPTVPAPLRAAGQVLPLPPPRCRKRSEAPTVSHLIAKVKRRLQDPYHSV